MNDRQNSDMDRAGVFQSVCVIKADEDFTIYAANQNFYRIIGCSPEELKWKYAGHFSALTEPHAVRKLREFADEADEGMLQLEHTVKNGNDVSFLVTVVKKLRNRKQELLMLTSKCVNDLCKKDLYIADLKEELFYLSGHLEYGLLEYEPETGWLTRVLPGCFSLEELELGRPFWEEIMKKQVIAQEGWNVLFQAAEKAEASGGSGLAELLVKGKDGSYKWARAFLGSMKRDGKTCMVCLFMDISIEKDASVKYLEETCFYQSVLSDQDAYGHLDVTEDKLLRVGGMWYIYREVMDSMTFTELFMEFKEKVIHPEDRERYMEVLYRKNLLNAYDSGITHLGCEFRRIMDQNRMAWMELSVHLFRNPIDDHVMGLACIKNIDSKRKQRMSLMQSEEFDRLTGLYSQKTAEARIQDYMEQMREGSTCTLVLADIDDMEAWNYKLGRDAGDLIVAAAANVIKMTFRTEDILGHVGGDEFMVFAKGLNDTDIIGQRLDQLRRQLEEVCGYPVTVSMGAVKVKKHDAFDRIYQKADVALYAAKQSGKNCHIFYSEAEGTPKGYESCFSASGEAEFKDICIPAGDFDALVGNCGDMAYLVNPRTYELMRGNQSFYNRIGKTEDECAGMKCYELLHKRVSPCPFCRSANWTLDKCYMYRNYNEVLEQEFLIKNRLVIWKGMEALLAVAIDLSNDKNLIDFMGDRSSENDCILSGIQHMQAAENLDQVIDRAMETIGMFFRADQVAYWKNGEDRYDRARSWMASPGGKDRLLTENDQEAVTGWLQNGKWGDEFLAESQERMLSQSYSMNTFMKRTGAESQWWVKWSAGSSQYGFFQIDNARRNTSNYGFLRSLLAFTAEEHKKRSLVESILYTNSHDALTDVENRSSYEQYLKSFDPDNCETAAAVVININNLNEINKNRGFECGNACIRQLADILAFVFQIHRIYRLNGDEFLIVICNEKQGTVEALTDHMEERIREIGDFTVSSGYSWDDVEKDLGTLAEYATQVMKLNKRHFYDTGHAQRNRGREEVLNHILKVIDSQEMEAYLQPKVDSRTGLLCGAEALVRIHHQEYGIIPPAQFIGSLEKNHLIRYVDLFVFEQTLKTLERWKTMGLSSPVISVNFSRLTLMEQDLVRTLNQIMGQYDVEKGSIEVEITESCEDIGKAFLYQAVRKLHESGYKISLDDFGTKYTNLSILSDIDVDVMKLDKSLITSMVDSEKNQIILKNIISMCGQLKVDVVAEGVETKEQEAVLNRLGCYKIQGYLYSKPIPVREFERLFMNMPGY